MLPPRQYEIIRVVVNRGEVSVKELASELSKRPSDIMRDLEELSAKGLISISRERSYLVRVTNLALRYLKTGLPEEVVLGKLRELKGEANLNTLKNSLALDSKEFSAAIGLLRKYGALMISGEQAKLASGGEANAAVRIREVKDRIARLARNPLIFREVKEIPGWVKELKRRGFISIEEAKELRVKPRSSTVRMLNEGRIKPARIITVLKQQDIVSGAWRNAIFKKYDLSIDVPTVYPVRKHPYIQFLNYVRYVISSMGFFEVKGPYVESELWNFDILFVPQYHPARRDTDVYFIKGLPPASEDEGLLKVVKEVHEYGWGYRWDPLKALRLILRTHTTPVSIRTICERGGGEYRAFSLDRVFRPDTPDPTHLMEFHQLEGIIVGRRVAFKHLLGFFKAFAKFLGLGEVRFKPAYFPFTEPSVEGFIKHPKLGWIEVFPGGMFRPEVLKAVGLEGYNVAAWGIGIDRIAMLILGIDDIRNLYTNNLQVIRRIRPPNVVMR